MAIHTSQRQTDTATQDPGNSWTAPGVRTVARLTALGFAIGSAVHATAFVVMWFGIRWYGPTYPAWRHVVMAAIDASIAMIGIRRPAWLLVALPAWIAEQWIVNGFNPECALVTVAVVALAWTRTRTTTPPVPRENTDPAA